MKDKEISKLFHAYDKAEWALIKRRDELFPPGTKIVSRLNPDMVTEVTDGSLYPHQVNTRYGHMSWRFFDKVSD